MANFNNVSSCQGLLGRGPHQLVSEPLDSGSKKMKNRSRVGSQLEQADESMNSAVERRFQTIEGNLSLLNTKMDMLFDQWSRSGREISQNPQVVPSSSSLRINSNLYSISTPKHATSVHSTTYETGSQNVKPVFSPSSLSQSHPNIVQGNPRANALGNSRNQPNLRLKMPDYNGEGDVEEWILKLNHYFNYYFVPDWDKVRACSVQLKGRAAHWFVWLMQHRGGSLSWGEFCQAIKLEYGPTQFTDYVTDLKLLKQEGTVQENDSSFNTEEELSAPVLDLDASDHDSFLSEKVTVQLVGMPEQIGKENKGYTGGKTATMETLKPTYHILWESTGNPSVQDFKSQVTADTGAPRSIDRGRSPLHQCQYLVMVWDPGSLVSNVIPSQYIGGLKDEIRFEVQIAIPSNLPAAMQLARVHEAKVAAFRKTYKPLNTYSKPTRSSHIPTTPNFDNGKKATTTAYPPKTAPVPAISPSEINRRKSLGLCFVCEEKWFKGHRCKEKKLFMISSEQEGGVPPQMIENTIDESLQQITPGSFAISMQALPGTVMQYSTMKLKETLNNKPVMILIDSGFAHSFVDSQFRDRVGLKLSSQEEYEVMIANVRSIKRLANVVTLFQCVAANIEAMQKFVDSRFPNYLIPLINFGCLVEVLENVRSIAFSVIGILCQHREPKIIQWAIESEIMAICHTVFYVGSELNKMIAMHIIEAKVASGNGEPVLSRDVYRLGFFRMLSFFYTMVWDPGGRRRIGRSWQSISRGISEGSSKLVSGFDNFGDKLTQWQE